MAIIHKITKQIWLQAKIEGFYKKKTHPSISLVWPVLLAKCEQDPKDRAQLWKNYFTF
jgi:hypothetical protein